MNNSEIHEIKKRLKFCDDDSFRIETCYVIGNEKRIQSRMNTYLSNLDDSDRHKYIDILKKGLSGVLNRNLLNLSFERSMEGNDAQKFLLSLRDSCLANQGITDKLYEKIINSYSTVGNYLIITIYDAYDIPREGSDGYSQGESEEVFRYIYSCICPVNLDKAALSYREEENDFAAKIREWVVEMPEIGFMYPAFNDRSSDVNSLLYYCKDPLLIHAEVISDCLGCVEEMTSVVENRLFKNVIEDVINEAPEYDTFEVVRNVQDNINEMLENKVFSMEPTIDREGVTKLLRDSGIKEEHLAIVEDKFDKEIGRDGILHPERIKEKGRLEVKGENIKISVKPEASSLVEIKIIDGRKCLVIPMDSDMEVNGIIKKITEKLKEEA